MSKAIFKLGENTWSFTDESQPTDDPTQHYLMPGEVKELERTRLVNAFFKGGGIVHATKKELEEYNKKVRAEKKRNVTDSKTDIELKFGAQIKQLQDELLDAKKQNEQLAESLDQAKLDSEAELSDIKDKLDQSQQVGNQLSESNDKLQNELASIKAAHETLIEKTNSAKK